MLGIKIVFDVVVNPKPKLLLTSRKGDQETVFNYII